MICLIMTTSMLAGCMEDEPVDDDAGKDLLDDEWDVYYVDSEDELPACESSTLGRLYYVASTAGFQTCTSAGWVSVDLTGPAGPKGPPGEDGLDGADGADGQDGTAGTSA